MAAAYQHKIKLEFCPNFIDVCLNHDFVFETKYHTFLSQNSGKD